MSFRRHFPGLGDTEAELLRQACTVQTVAAGQSVFNEGDLGDSMCCIESGAMQMVKSIDVGAERVLATFKEGDLFGEMSFLDGRRRSATARAAEDSTLLVLARPKFEGVSRQHPRIAGICFASLASLIADRLRAANDAYRALGSELVAASGANRLTLDRLSDTARNVRVHVSHGEPVAGRLIYVAEDRTVHVRDNDGRPSLIPYHAIVRVEVVV